MDNTTSNTPSINATSFIKYLKLTNQFDDLIEKLVLQKSAVLAAADMGISASDEEVQESADLLRRAMGLHKAKDMLDHLDRLGLEVADFAEFVKEATIIDKLKAHIVTDEAIDNYYALHEPRFRQADISIIVLAIDEEDKAREMAMTLSDLPEDFMDMAKDHSHDAETASKGGRVGVLSWDDTHESIADAVFNATAGDILGPINVDNICWQIIQVHSVSGSQQDAKTRDQIATCLYDEWLEKSADAFPVEMVD